MPRDGSGVYSADWVNAAPNTTIESSKQNALVADLVTDANAARPITAGGTGAITAIGAADALHTQSTNIASAATTDLSTATGMYAAITGTTTITAFGTEAAGVVRMLKFTGILTLTYNATSLILPGAANITTAAGDIAIFVSEGSGNWRCLSYQRFATIPVRSQAWEFIGVDTPSAASAATFSGLSAYRLLRATFYFTQSVDGEAIFAQTSVSGTFATSGSDYNNQVISGFGITVNTANAAAAGFRIGFPGNAATEAVSGTMTVFEFNQAKQAHHVTDAFYLDTTTTPIKSVVAGRRLDTSARDGLRFLPNSGTITGYVILEGIRG